MYHGRQGGVWVWRGASGRCVGVGVCTMAVREVCGCGCVYHGGQGGVWVCVCAVREVCVGVCIMAVREVCVGGCVSWPSGRCVCVCAVREVCGRVGIDACVLCTVRSSVSCVSL